MTDYKLVPVEPTPEWIANLRKIRIDRMESVIEDVLAAAPAVQGEPVSAQFRYRRLERSLPSCSAWSAWQPAEVDETRPTYHFDEQGWEVEYRLLYAAPQPAERPTISAYACTVPDDCETLHWRGQILSMNELVSVAQPAVDEEIHVHIEGRDVLTLPLASSGMSAPRFVVHVPAQQPAEQQPAPGVPGLTEALRQYQHNDGSGLVFGYDKLLVDQYVAGLVVTLKSIEEWVMRYADPKHPVATVARKALAAHRKGGES